MTASQGEPSPVKYLTTIRLGEKGQLTIPKSYRDAFELEAGAPITVLQLGTSLVLIPEQTQFQELCDRLASRFLSQGVRAQALLLTLPNPREEVFASHYPELAE